MLCGACCVIRAVWYCMLIQVFLSFHSSPSLPLLPFLSFFLRYDSDHPRVPGDVGMAGVAIDSIEDMKVCTGGHANIIHIHIHIQCVARLIFTLKYDIHHTVH